MDVHSQEKISQDELQSLFGPTIPIEAAALLMGNTMTIADVRRDLVTIAGNHRPLVIARECIAAINTCWREEEDEDAAREIALIIAKYIV